MAKKYLLLYIFLASLPFSSCKHLGDKETSNIALEQQSVFPEPLGYVSDYANILTLEQTTEIAQFIDAFEKRPSNEIAIALFESIPIERDFKRYCVELSNTWGVGKVGKDNGIVLIVDLQNKRGAINTGNQISKVLTDESCGNILREVAFPNFKQEQYYEGIKQSLIALVEIWDKEHDT